jgi:acetyl-CoA synthetase
VTETVRSLATDVLPATSRQVIRKHPASGRLAPNVCDYDEECASFSWARARGELTGLPHGAGLNIAYEAVDRHAAGPRATHEALRFLGRGEQIRSMTYAGLSIHSNRFANVLRDLGVGKGDRVFSLLGRCPELYVSLFGTLKNVSVFSPLFSAFGPDPVHQRLALGDASVLVTTSAFYRRKVAPIRAGLPGLRHVLLVDEASEQLPGTEYLGALLDAASPDFVIPPTDPSDMALLHFTSGTTGTPKGAIHVHEAVVAHHETGRTALDLHPQDVFWCTADPGWVTGTSYGVISPLTNGVTTIVDQEEMDPSRWYSIIDRHHVTVWYTAPTALRMLMKLGEIAIGANDLSTLRFIASVGEPLNPEVVVWTQQAYGTPAHDNWWQTETGGIMIANLACADVRPGSMGRPLPGVQAAILARDDNAEPLRDDRGSVVLVTDASAKGELVLRPGWPSMFRGYLHDDDRYRRSFVDGWYRTGDLVRRDDAGYYWFVGRGDDVIKSAGHLIGPFEVESALIEHPAVAEAGVVGRPDAIAGEIVKAYVVLVAPYQPTEQLRLELIGFARKRLGSAVAPREIEFVTELPKTNSGKIMRGLLKARDTRTIESATTGGRP